METTHEMHDGRLIPAHPYERTMRLSETSNMLRRLATAEIAMHGVYYALVDDVRTRILADSYATTVAIAQEG